MQVASTARELTPQSTIPGCAPPCATCRCCRLRRMWTISWPASARRRFRSRRGRSPNSSRTRGICRAGSGCRRLLRAGVAGRQQQSPGAPRPAAGERRSSPWPSWPGCSSLSGTRSSGRTRRRRRRPRSIRRRQRVAISPSPPLRRSRPRRRLWSHRRRAPCRPTQLMRRSSRRLRNTWPHRPMRPPCPRSSPSRTRRS